MQFSGSWLLFRRQGTSGLLGNDRPEGNISEYGSGSEVVLLRWKVEGSSLELGRWISSASGRQLVDYKIYENALERAS
jgi:hypothetical protein